MAAVPLGDGAYERADGFVPEVVCRNFYAEPDKSGISPTGKLHIQRPGLSLVYTLSGRTRGAGYNEVTSESLFVAGINLYANGVDRGNIGGTGIAQMVGTAFYYAILGGPFLYLYNGTTIIPVVMPDDAGVIAAIDQINGYILILMTSGRFYWIVPGETTVDPFNFATAESSPDAGRAIVRVGSEFWIFGSDSTEPWQTTGDADAPFQRVAGRLFEQGIQSRDSARRFDNSVMWVTDNNQVCRGGAVPQVVSSNGLSERIRKRTGNVSAWTFAFDGHEFYCLKIPGHGTFCYDALTQEWPEFASLNFPTWRAHVGFDANGVILAGDSESGRVWRLDTANSTDDYGGTGVVIERTVTGTVSLIGQTPRNDSLSVGVGCNVDTVIRVRWKDGQEDFPDYYDEIDIRAPLDVATIYRLGQPEQPYRTVEISCVDVAGRVSIYGCVANESFG